MAKSTDHVSQVMSSFPTLTMRHPGSWIAEAVLCVTRHLVRRGDGRSRMRHASQSTWIPRCDRAALSVYASRVRSPFGGEALGVYA